MNVELIIKEHSLLIDKNDEEFINNFSSTTGTNFPKGKLGNYLSSWFEGYIFTLLIGIITGERRYTGFVDKSQKIKEWNTATFHQYKFCLSLLLSKKEIVRELEIDSRSNIGSVYLGFENNELLSREILSKLKNIADEYSLGGIDFIRRYHDEKEPNLFDDPFAMYKIFMEAKKVK